MNEIDLLSEASVSIEAGNEEIGKINFFAEKLDFLDVQLLRKFYSTGREFPNDCQPYCFPVLYTELKVNHQIKMGLEALRKRLDNLVMLELLVKVKNSNPTNYYPLRGKERFLRAVIMKFFLINGLSKFL
ncbi:MAG: hypothetical protein HY361_01400 [Candidatus Aenigmarchaeota archaeon]|nr:hypothetical protein [Candidatus Aenigmarchaeota archaeon]